MAVATADVCTIHQSPTPFASCCACVLDHRTSWKLSRRVGPPCPSPSSSWSARTAAMRWLPRCRKRASQQQHCMAASRRWVVWAAMQATVRNSDHQCRKLRGNVLIDSIPVQPHRQLLANEPPCALHAQPQHIGTPSGHSCRAAGLRVGPA